MGVFIKDKYRGNMELTYIPLHIIFIILTKYFPKYFIFKIFKVETNLLSRLVIGISFNIFIFLLIMKDAIVSEPKE